MTPPCLSARATTRSWFTSSSQTIPSGRSTSGRGNNYGIGSQPISSEISDRRGVEAEYSALGVELGKRGRCWPAVTPILYLPIAALARLTVHSGRSMDLEIIVLRHPDTVLGVKSTSQPSRTMTGHCSAQCQLRPPVHNERAGSSPPAPRCDGSFSVWRPRTRPGATGASAVNSSASVTRSQRPPSGRS